MKMRSLLAAGTAAFVLATAPTCAQEMKAEVIHWWTSGGESAAVKVFADQFTKSGGTWLDSAVAGGVNARTAAINRTVGGNPPTAMQFNTGRQFEELVENNLLADVEAVAAENKWKAVLPEALINATTRNGKMFAVPVNIHGQNWLFYNKDVLAKAGVAEPKNWDEAIAGLEKIKATGAIPLAFSGAKNWERLLFNSVLVDKGGPALWNSFWGKRDAASIQSPQFRAAADTFKKLKNYVDAGSPGRNWNDATALVIQGKAGMQIMGDWAKGEFAAAGKVPEKDYGCTVLATSGHGFVFGGDVFAFPKQKDAAASKSQAQLAKIMLDPVTQIEFSKKKGSLPARLDLDVSGLDACAQKGMKLVQEKTVQLPADAMLAPPATMGAIEDVISQFWNTGMTTDQFIEKVNGAAKQQ
ncbi:MAG: ABC transporter substrate-binding protein [Beijerinckiaceae bacterium]